MVKISKCVRMEIIYTDEQQLFCVSYMTFRTHQKHVFTVMNVFKTSLHLCRNQST